MSYTIGKTYVLANDTNYTPGIKGMVDTVTVETQPSFLSPGPFTSSIISSAPNVGSGLTVDITTIDGTVTALGAITSTPNAYTAGTYLSVATITSGAGTGLTVDITVNITGDISEIVIDNAGSGYAISDGITVLGTLLGGATPADDVTFNINTITSIINTIVPTPGVPGKNYVPGVRGIVDEGSNDGIVNFTVINGIVALSDSHILGFHVLATNTADVIVTHANNSQTTFTLGSLVTGAIYPYSVIKVELQAGDVGTLLGTAPSVKTVMF